jgi:hypothetical protein
MAVGKVVLGRFAAMVTVMVAVGALTPGAAGAAPAAQVTAVAAGPGCPATLQAWTPQVTAAPAGDPGALAPGSLSASAREAFGTKVAGLLAGRPGPWRWLGSTTCQITRGHSVPNGAADRTATAGSMSYSPNWSGYETDDPAGSRTFTGAAMEWTVPGFAASAAEGASASIWPGIGAGDTDDKLIQAGSVTTYSAATGSKIVAWLEIYPDENEMDIGFPVKAGDDVAVYVAFDPSTHTAAFFFVNYTTGFLAEFTQQVSGSSGKQAEWIVERHGECGTACVYTPMYNFGATTVRNGTADRTVNGNTTTNYIDGFPLSYPYTMVACSGSDDGTNQPVLAAPGRVDATGTFTDTWKNSGHDDPDDCTWRVQPANTTVNATIGAGKVAMLADTTANLTLTCHGATMSGRTGDAAQQSATVAIVAITAGSLSSCTDALGNGWSARQTSGSVWNLGGYVGNTKGDTTSGLSGIEADVTGSFAGGSCSFHIAGAASPGNALFHNASGLELSRADLKISQVTGAGCGSARIANGDSATLSGAYSFPGLTVKP